MGEVYRARDTRLDRTVAIKVLPEHLSQSPQAKERFDREARAISSFSHPNICQLYDVGQQDGISYLVMEYLEGETLADRLRKGPLPLDQALRAAAEICEGLEKAHRSGVVHRDLKPGNINVSPFPAADSRWLVSNGGGEEPRWRRDGKELFYLSAAGKMTAVAVTIGSTFKAGSPVALFQTHLRQPISQMDLVSYDVSDDGQRFLVNTKVDESSAAPLAVLLNWASEMDK